VVANLEVGEAGEGGAGWEQGLKIRFVIAPRRICRSSGPLRASFNIRLVKPALYNSSDSVKNSIWTLKDWGPGVLVARLPQSTGHQEGPLADEVIGDEGPHAREEQARQQVGIGVDG
jgi:hypothetical protein